MLGIEVSSIAAINIYVMSDTSIRPRLRVYLLIIEYLLYTSILQYYTSNLFSNIYNNILYYIYCYLSFSKIENCATVYCNKLQTRRYCVDIIQRLFGHTSDATITKMILNKNIIDRKTISLRILLFKNTIK